MIRIENARIEARPWQAAFLFALNPTTDPASVLEGASRSGRINSVQGRFRGWSWRRRQCGWA
jgi:hypothetical protein